MLSLLKYPKALYMVLFFFLYRKLLAQSIEEKKWGLGGEKKEGYSNLPVKNPLNGSDMAVKVF